MDNIQIIMAVYNGEKFIGEQIDSILDSVYIHWTLWIFDDGSTDQTPEIIEEYRKRNPEKIHYMRNDINKGVSHNFLEGLMITRDKISFNSSKNKDDRNYFMFCDQDDVWDKDKIIKTLSLMKKTEKLSGVNCPVIVYTDARVVDENLNSINSSFHISNHLNVTKTDLPHILMENKLIGCTVMCNTVLVDKLEIHKDIDIRYHDWWLAIIASAFGRIAYLPESTLAYRQHGNNVVGNQNFHDYVMKRLGALKKQKLAIYENVKQAESFYSIYKNELKAHKKMQIYSFTKLKNQNWFKKRITVIKHGFLKTGIIRNIGLLLIL